MNNSYWLLTAVALAALLGCSRVQPPQQVEDRRWEDVLVDLPPVWDVEIAEEIWVCAGGTGVYFKAVLLRSELDPIEWEVVGSTESNGGWMALGDDVVWLGGGANTVSIVEYSRLGYARRTLPTVRYRRPSGVDPSTRQKSLMPRKFLDGLAAADGYLWAWFLSEDVVVTQMGEKTEWWPDRYASQCCTEPGPWFSIARGWAWRDLFICTVYPYWPYSQETPAWPIRLCILSAQSPERGRRLQPPPALAGYTISGVCVGNDRVWVLGENEGRLPGFEGPRWALMTVSLPDLKWQRLSAPTALQAWNPRWDRWMEMAVEGSRLVLGNDLTASPAGGLVVLDLETGTMETLEKETGAVGPILDLELKNGWLWVAHLGGVSRVRLCAKQQVP